MLGKTYTFYEGMSNDIRKSLWIKAGLNLKSINYYFLNVINKSPPQPEQFWPDYVQGGALSSIHIRIDFAERLSGMWHMPAYNTTYGPDGLWLQYFNVTESWSLDIEAEPD